ncbi:MAG: hypothetical protein AAB870_04190 [Patescibacteria group bacterium]
MLFKTKKSETVQSSRGIESIYSTLGQQEGMTAIVKPTNNGKKLWIIAALLFLAVSASAAWLGSQIFSTNKEFQEERVSIKMDGPRTVASSEEVIYTITYHNDDPNPMTKVVITAEYPQGFSVISTEPAANNDLNNRWEQEFLKTGETGTITIKGQLRGDEGQEQALKAMITYVPANFNSPFSQEDTLLVTVQSSLLNIQLNGPQQANPGDEVQYEITYDDFGAIYKKDDVQLRLNYPKGFAFKESNPKADFGQDVWTAATLLNGIDPNTKQGSVKVNGVFNSETPSGEVELGAMFGYGHDDTFTPEKNEHFSTEITNGDFILRLQINNTQTNPVVNVGEPITVVLDYENKGKYPLSDVTLSTTLDSPFIDWVTLKDSKSAEFERDTLTWSRGKTSALARVAPGSKGQLSFKVSIAKSEAIVNLFKGGLADINNPLAFNASAKATYKVTPYENAPPLGDTVDIKTGVTTVMINSDLSLDAQARYFDDQKTPVGSGPLPPQVGQTTTYSISWNLNNTLHDLDQIRVTTILPPEVTWSSHERADVGAIQYDAATRSVSWVIDRMSTLQPVLTADFTVSITPGATYVQKLITLTGDAGITAQDSINHSKISLKRPPLTTNLDFDPVGKGKGLVQP